MRLIFIGVEADPQKQQVWVTTQNMDLYTQFKPTFNHVGSFSLALTGAIRSERIVHAFITDWNINTYWHKWLISIRQKNSAKLKRLNFPDKQFFVSLLNQVYSNEINKIWLHNFWLTSCLIVMFTACDDYHILKLY